MKLRRLASFVAASAVIIGTFGMSTGTVLGADGQVEWTGNGASNGLPNDIKCDENHTPYLYWVFSPGGNDSVESATITFGGTGFGTYDLDQDSGQWKLTDGPWFDLGGLTAVVDYTGSLGNGKAVVTISHGCPGTTTTTTTTTTSTTTVPTTTTTTTTTTAATTTTTAATTTTTSFSQTVSGTTDTPTEPNTATIEVGGPSNPSSGVWMLIVALGVLLGSIVILTPAPAKTKR